MDTTILPRAVSIPKDVASFAVDHGVQAELPAVLQMTRRVFPHANIQVELDEDPEIADDRHIVVLVRAVSMPVDQAVEMRWQWHRGLLACCPAPLVWVFRLGLELNA